MLINQGCLTNVTQFHEWNSVIFRSEKYTQVTVKSKKDADMHDTALEWFSFSRNV